MKKQYARYVYNRGLIVLWKGDPAEPGSLHRSIALVTDAFNSTVGACQVYELEGVSKGVSAGQFAGSEENPTLRFDQDFGSFDEAGKKIKELTAEAETEGFRQLTLWDQIEFDEKARATQRN